jgi:hypothetical protein
MRPECRTSFGRPSMRSRPSGASPVTARTRPGCVRRVHDHSRRRRRRPGSYHDRAGTPAAGRAGSGVSRPSPGATVEEITGAPAALAAPLRDRLSHAAAIAATARHQTACEDAARAADPTARQGRRAGPADVRVAQALADVATISLRHERSMRHSDTHNELLQTAPKSRVIIEQANASSPPGAQHWIVRSQVP